MDKLISNSPTTVLLHGILGSWKNWGKYGELVLSHFYFYLLH